MPKCVDCEQNELYHIKELESGICRYCMRHKKVLEYNGVEYRPIKTLKSTPAYGVWSKNIYLKPIISNNDVELIWSNLYIPTKFTSKKTKYLDLLGITTRDIAKEYATPDRTRDYVAYLIYTNFGIELSRPSISTIYHNESLPYFKGSFTIPESVDIANIVNFDENKTSEQDRKMYMYQFIKKALFINGVEMSHITLSGFSDILLERYTGKLSKGAISKIIVDEYNKGRSVSEIMTEIYVQTGKHNPNYKDYIRKVLLRNGLINEHTRPTDNGNTASQLTLSQAIKQVHNGNTNLTFKQIYTGVCNLLNKRFAKTYFYTTLSKLGLEYNRLSPSPRSVVTKSVESSNVITPIQECIEIDGDTVTTADVVTTDVENTVTVNRDRIQQEVISTICDKSRKLNCSSEKDYTTNTYITLLDTLLYLAKNKVNLQRTRLDQKDITQSYQEDVLHEIEFTDTKPGDTSLQDKLKCIRELRRYFEHDYEDLTILSNFLTTIDTDKLSESLEELKQKQNARNEKYFYIPRVDDNLTKKYDWARTGQFNSKVVNTPLLRTANRVMGYKFCKYVVTCEVSGYGIGTFKKWRREVLATDEDAAIKQAVSVLTNTKNQKNGNYMWTNLKVELLQEE